MNTLFSGRRIFDPRIINPAITEERQSGDFRVLSINTKEATYRGYHWRDLGNFGKRKFENLLVIQYPQDRLKFIYG